MKIGYAMYSARDLTKDPEGMRNTLKQLAEMGYEGVEFFVYADTDPAELRAMLDEYGLEAIGTHIHKPRWDKDTDGEIAYAVRAGIPYLVYPFIQPQDRTAEFYGELPAYLDELASKCRKAGIQLQYHNHDFEFEPLGEKRVIDHLLSEGKNYTFELDTFWADYAGTDVPVYLEELGSRIPMIHIKDCTRAKTEEGRPEICAIGTGIVDNASIVRKAAEMDKEWLIVELDQTPLTPMESAAISIANVKKMLGGEN